MISISDLSTRIAGRLLLDKASVTLPSGTKAGLVGRNGAGKSTLFKVITGDHGAETGSVSIPKNARIGQVAQEAPGTEDSLIEIVMAADKERAALMLESETATDPERISDIQMRLVDIDAHSAEARASSILAGLGFDQEAQLRPASSFSGGWRMRVALASVLFAEPDLLLLDEPTNYLDLEGSLWLEDYIRRYPYTVIIISHDRDLLNNAVNAIVHLPEEVDLLPWWIRPVRTPEGRKRRAAKQGQGQERSSAQAPAELHRPLQGQGIESQAGTIARQGPGADGHRVFCDRRSRSTHDISYPEKQPASPIIAIDGGSVGYEPGNPILKGIDLRIDNDDRIALLGSNGNGKSTFAKFISGRLAPETGDLRTAPSLKVGFFAQHQMDDLVPEDSAVDHVRKLMPQAPESKVRARVAQMGLATEKMATAAKDLSGGEKARLLMGLAAFHAPNLLILDEPTNHLDIDSRRALIEALNDYDGAVILISHDRHLIEATADRLWLVNNGTVTTFEGDMDEYRDIVVSSGKKKKKKKN